MEQCGSSCSALRSPPFAGRTQAIEFLGVDNDVAVGGIGVTFDDGFGGILKAAPEPSRDYLRQPELWQDGPKLARRVPELRVR
jgi:hypothetical protein